MDWVWFVVAGVVALGNLFLFGFYGMGTELLRRPRVLQVLQAVTMLGLWLTLAEVWVHASGAASWHSWPLMWLAPVAALLQLPFRVLPDEPRGRSVPVVLVAAGLFALPALLMLPTGEAPLG